MKTLFLVRHAKSSWENPRGGDFDRPLNSRGFDDAPIMAAKIKELCKIPDVIISSPALRAITTAQIFSDGFGIPQDKIIKDMSIYDKGHKHIINLVDKYDNKYSSLMFFGHNPDISTLATYFSGEFIDDVPTCCVICIDFDVDSWDAIKKQMVK